MVPSNVEYLHEMHTGLVLLVRKNPISYSVHRTVNSSIILTIRLQVLTLFHVFSEIEYKI